MHANKTKARLLAGESVYGVVVRFPAPALVEMFGHLGFDFVMIDREHGSLSLEGAEELIRAADATGITPIVRVPHAHPKEISCTLDIGALGVQVPEITSKADAEALVRAAKYWPIGARGMAMARAGDYGMTLDQMEFVRRANDETMIVAHVESLEAIANLPQMLTVGGIDVFFIGPADLSQSMGYPGQLSHPAVLAKIDETVAVIRAARRIAGIYASQAETLVMYRELGVRYLMTSADNLIRRVGREFMTIVRA